MFHCDVTNFTLQQEGLSAYVSLLAYTWKDDDAGGINFVCCRGEGASAQNASAYPSAGYEIQVRTGIASDSNGKPLKGKGVIYAQIRSGPPSIDPASPLKPLIPELLHVGVMELLYLIGAERFQCSLGEIAFTELDKRTSLFIFDTFPMTMPEERRVAPLEPPQALVSAGREIASARIKDNVVFASGNTAFAIRCVMLG